MPKQLLVCLLLLFSGQILFGKSIRAATTVIEINGLEQPWASLRGGDTILLQTGARAPLQISNLSGNSKKNIVVINGKGVVKITSTNLPYGISIRNCHYIKLSGKGSAKISYGINVAQVLQEGAGIGVSDKTDNIEIENIEISHTKGPGVLCKTNPDCTTNCKSFTGYNYSIHENYIHHTGTEGLYIGSTAFDGERINCGGRIKTILPPVLNHVQVFSNRVEFTGWDGIQISYAVNVSCNNNVVLYDSQKQTDWQNCGIMIGGGTSGNFYSNTISLGKGYAFNCFGTGEVVIKNNTIKMDSAENKVAIYLNDKLVKDKAGYTIEANSITTRYLPAIKCVNKNPSVIYKIHNNKIYPEVKTKEYIQMEK